MDGRDFFTYDKPVDIICSNPPYSMIDDVIKKSIELNPRVISYLIGQGNMTAKRIEDFNKAGYYLKQTKMLKVMTWYGMSYIVVFEKDSHNCIQIDRQVYYPDDYKRNKQLKKEKKTTIKYLKLTEPIIDYYNIKKQ